MPKMSSQYDRSVTVRHTKDDAWASNNVEFLLADNSRVRCYRHGEATFTLDDEESMKLDCIVYALPQYQLSGSVEPSFT